MRRMLGVLGSMAAKYWEGEEGPREGETRDCSLSEWLL